ncbi:hypothetical protein P8A22_24630 [Streptomyces laculatispora]|uniref:DUF7848 domain-containing protein n=1 Tax=Streptomyces laculatispora TaxID=887464 RepID=A0ABY9I9P2_9ACTN|nr:hypothetical protein [Streptomyces laculatispora]WLQ42838.1 hypothetical protein P8A22_24630 [Streptomyces laculatispora]
MPSEQLRCAVRMRRGDLVHVQGKWREVCAVRLDRYATGGMAVVLTFAGGGRPLRVPADHLVTVPAPEPSAPPDRVLVEDASDCPAVHETECTTCGEGPEPTVSQDVAVRHLWCAEHVVRTGHTGFLALRVGLLRAVAVHEVRR